MRTLVTALFGSRPGGQRSKGRHALLAVGRRPCWHNTIFTCPSPHQTQVVARGRALQKARVCWVLEAVCDSKVPSFHALAKWAGARLNKPQLATDTTQQGGKCPGRRRCSSFCSLTGLFIRVGGQSIGRRMNGRAAAAIFGVFIAFPELSFGYKGFQASRQDARLLLIK